MPASAVAQAPNKRAAANRANSRRSTGPRTEEGKQRSSLNALRHGLTSQSPVLPSEDLAAYQLRLQQLIDEYVPATPTESQLVQELAGTAWRMNRIPILEAGLLEEHLPAELLIKSLASLSAHGQRLNRLFMQTLEQLRTLQAARREQELKDFKDAAAVLQLHKDKNIPWVPSDHGFVFSKEQVERQAERMDCIVEARRWAQHAAFPNQPTHRAF